jgi:HlyD family secretion protein
MAMDKKIEKRKGLYGKKLLYTIGGMLLLVLLFFGFKTINKKVYKLNRDKISVKQVIEGDFQDMIMINGDVEPINLILVNTMEGGSVDEIFVEDGTRVKKGDPLLRLNNPSVMLGYMNQETAIIEQVNNLRNLKFSLEKEQIRLAETLIDTENKLSEVERTYRMDSVLYRQEVLAQKEFTDIQELYKYWQKKRDFMDRNVRKNETGNAVQIKQINQSIQLMQRNLDLIHRNMEKMLVRAPQSGMLSSFDPVIGESYARNQTVAKIDVQSGFKIKGQVDEYYLSLVKPGQKARFSFNGELVALEVKKVLPEVVERLFEIELVFVDSIPQDITIGQSLQVRLELSKAQPSVMIARGSYFQASGGQYVYVLDGNGQAVKRKIQLGKKNPSHYQVLSGLEAGEQFISSSYDDFKEYEILKINN